MKKAEIVNNWLQSSQEDYNLAKKCFTDEYYQYTLFYCHLSIEKLLKGLILEQKNEPAPYIHDLVKLCKFFDKNPDDKTILDLKEITTFNIQARYDTEKRSLYKKATKEFTQKILEKTKKIRIWLKK